MSNDQLVDKVKRFMNKPVPSIFGTIIPGTDVYISIGIFLLGTAIMLGVQAGVIDYIKGQMVDLLVTMPNFDIHVDADGKEAGNFAYNTYSMLRGISIIFFIVVIILVGIFMVIRDQDFVKDEQIKHTLKFTLIGIIIIAIFPYIWDGISDASSDAGSWMLNPLYSKFEIEPGVTQCGLNNINYNEVRLDDYNTINGTMRIDANNVYYCDIPSQNKKIRQVYDNYEVYRDDNTNICNDIFTEKYTFTRSIDGIWSINYNSIDENDKPDTTMYNLVNENLLMLLQSGKQIESESKIKQQLCDRQLRIDYIFAKAFWGASTNDLNQQNDFIGFLGAITSDPLGVLQDAVTFVFMRTFMISTLFSVAIGVFISGSARILITDLIAMGLPIFIMLHLIPYPPDIKKFTNKYITSFIPLLLLPFFAALTIFVGASSLLSLEQGVVESDDSNRRFSFWIQAMIVISLIPAVYTASGVSLLTSVSESLKRNVEQGVNRATNMTGQMLTSASIAGAVGGMSGARQAKAGGGGVGNMIKGFAGGAGTGIMADIGHDMEHMDKLGTGSDTYVSGSMAEELMTKHTDQADSAFHNMLTNNTNNNKITRYFGSKNNKG